MLFHDSIHLKPELLIKRNVTRVVRFQRNHQIVAFRVCNCLFHQRRRDSVMLHFRINRQINDMQSPILMQLIRPAGIQVIPAEHEIKKCFQAVILPDQIALRAQRRLHLRKITMQQMVRLRFIRND